MIEMQNMLLIAGNARNIGKTTLACAIIERFSAFQRIIGLKVTSMRKGEENYHGFHGNDIKEMFKLHEETDASSAKDTARMLAAGAGKAFYVQADDTHLEDIAKQIAGIVPNDCLVVCESGGLRKEIKPGAFIFLHTENSNRPIKKNYDIEMLADLVIDCSSGIQCVSKNTEKIDINKNRWILNN